MNSTFVATLHQADGRYLSDQELQPLETYCRGFGQRQQTYQLLSAQAETLVMQSLQRLAQTHRSTVQEHGPKCKRDMAYALSCIAKAVLSDETAGFQEDFVLWMENITRALHKGESAARAYGFLKLEIEERFPSPCAALVVPYLDNLIAAFSGPQ